MCVQTVADHVIQIPEVDIAARYALPGLPLKRAEYHTQLAGMLWKRDNLTVNVGANETMGVAWRVPEGEIWSVFYFRAQFIIGTARNWSQIKPQLWYGNPICLNGLWGGSKSSVSEIFGAIQTAGLFANFNKVWGRNDNNLLYNKWAEHQLASISAKIDGAAVWNEAWVEIMYYRTRLYDKLLDDLRKSEGDDCEVQKLLASAFPWVNERQDLDW